MDERRATPRTRLTAPVTCRVAADPPLSAAVRDVSADGLSFLSSRPSRSMTHDEKDGGREACSARRCRDAEQDVPEQADGGEQDEQEQRDGAQRGGPAACLRPARRVGAHHVPKPLDPIFERHGPHWSSEPEPLRRSGPPSCDVASSSR